MYAFHYEPPERPKSRVGMALGIFFGLSQIAITLVFFAVLGYFAYVLISCFV